MPPIAQDPAASTCTRCGTPLPERSGGLCLTCIGSWALDSGPAAADASAAGLPASLPHPLGDYELLEELGRGGMGVVYAARQRTLNRLVALKVLATGPARAAEAHSRFEREAQTIARLSHPGIVAIHAAGRLGELSWYAMDLVEGLDLARVCAGDPLEPREAARIVAAVARAVQYAHESGVIHRDLKPSNILIDAADQPRVVDFGLARWTQEPADLTHTGQILGSPAYMAPEQAAGQSTAAVDIHALGAVLFFALTGEPPYTGANAAEVLARVVTAAARAPSQVRTGIPAPLDAVVLRCLAREPAGRYATAREVAEDLELWLAGASVKTHYVPAAEARRIVDEIRRTQWLEGFQRHSIHGAIDQLGRAARLAPEYATAHADLARLHATVISSGWDLAPARRELARQSLARAEALEPDAPAVHLARAVCLNALDKRPDDAARVLRALVDRTPRDGHALLSLGRLALHAGRWQEAGEWLERAMHVDPPSGLPRQLAAYRACLLRDYPAAATWIDEAVRIDPRPIVRRLMRVWYAWLADPDPGRALAALREFPEDERRTRLIAGAQCFFLLAQRRFKEAHALYASTGDDADRVASPQAAGELADLLRLQRLAGAPGQEATEAALRASLEPTRVKSGRSAHESASLAYSWAVLGEAEAARKYAAEARATCPWPDDVIDGARLAGASEFLFAPGELVIFAMLGDLERFFAELPRWINVPAAVDVRYLAFEPWFDAVRADPRFLAITTTAQMPIEVNGPVAARVDTQSEAHRLVAGVQRRLWVEGYNWDVIPACAESLSRALEIAPDHAVALAELSRLHAAMASGGMDSTPARRELARITLERAEALDPGHPQVRAARAARLQWIDRDAPAAARLIDGVVRDQPEDGRSWTIAAQVAMMENRWAAAAGFFGRAAAIEPASAQARYLMARTCFFLRDYGSASTWMHESARIDPKPLHRRLHAIWFRWHADPEPGRALAQMRALPDEERFRREAAWCECQMLLTMRRFDEALALYERAAPEAGQGADIRSGYSLDETAYLLRLQRRAGSERRFETEKQLRAMLDPAREAARESASSLMTRAYAWATAGEPERAHEFMSRSLEARPWPAWAADAARLAGTNEFYFPVGQLTILALLGDADRFFAVLERWLNVPAAVNLRQLASDPLFDAMRGDARYARILSGAQLPIEARDPEPG